jgi:hypothetical protein
VVIKTKKSKCFTVKEIKRLIKAADGDFDFFIFLLNLAAKKKHVKKKK